MKWRNAIRRTLIILTLYGIGLAEAYYLPRYGIEWLLGGIVATVIVASFCNAAVPLSIIANSGRLLKQLRGSNISKSPILLIEKPTFDCKRT